MKTGTKVLIVGWTLYLAGMVYALLIPVGQGSVWILLPTTIIGIPLLIHFAGAAWAASSPEPSKTNHEEAKE